MSDKNIKRIEVCTAIGGLCLALVGMAGAFIILPSRVDAIEEKVHKMEAIQNDNRERLIRIVERLISIQENIKR